MALKIVKHLKVPVFGVGNLPDEHAEQAKKRDQAELSHLIESPAYRTTLRNLPLKKY